jgi:hypothetical protein
MDDYILNSEEGFKGSPIYTPYYNEEIFPSTGTGGYEKELNSNEELSECTPAYTIDEQEQQNGVVSEDDINFDT